MARESGPHELASELSRVPWFRVVAVVRGPASSLVHKSTGLLQSSIQGGGGGEHVPDQYQCYRKLLPAAIDAHGRGGHAVVHA